MHEVFTKFELNFEFIYRVAFVEGGANISQGGGAELSLYTSLYRPSKSGHGFNQTLSKAWKHTVVVKTRFASQEV